MPCMPTHASVEQASRCSIGRKQAQIPMHTLQTVADSKLVQPTDTAALCCLLRQAPSPRYHTTIRSPYDASSAVAALVELNCNCSCIALQRHPAAAPPAIFDALPVHQHSDNGAQAVHSDKCRGGCDPKGRDKAPSPPTQPDGCTGRSAPDQSCTTHPSAVIQTTHGCMFRVHRRFYTTAYQAALMAPGRA